MAMLIGFSKYTDKFNKMHNTEEQMFNSKTEITWEPSAMAFQQKTRVVEFTGHGCLCIRKEKVQITV